MASGAGTLCAFGSTPIRINSGGSTYTDSLGRTWSGDAGTIGVNTYVTSTPVSGTNDPAVYQSERYGSTFQYQYTVPNGVYTVNLKFAEIYWTKANQRVFNVSINNISVLKNFDIVAQAGPNTAIDKSYTISVTNGTISLQFTGIINNAKVSAVEIFMPTSATRLNVGGSSYTDPAGQVWSSGACSSGAYTFNVVSTITATTTPALYQSECYGKSFQYQFPVSNGTYTVNLKFAELYWTQANQRLFSVGLNGNPVLSNFDIFAEAGGQNIAVDRSFTVPVTNGWISIQFNTSIDNAKIDAIEILGQTAGSPGTPLSVTTASLPGGTVGASYSQTLTSSGGVAPYTWSVTNGALPPGLLLAGDTGIISGTPTSSIGSPFSVTVMVADGTQATANKALSIDISVPLTITTTSLLGGTQGSPYSQSLAATGGALPYTWAVASGTLPPGLSLAPSTGVVSGTPSTSTGSPFRFTIQASDAQMRTATQSYSVAIAPATAPAATEEFVCGNPCPFQSWINVKTSYGAIGDGISDDTAAIQAALNDAGTAGHGSVVYLPAGTYKITHNLQWTGKAGVSLVGHDPADTTIIWAGPAVGTVACSVPSTSACPNGTGNQACYATSMLWLNGVSSSRIARITWDGKGSAGIGVYHNWDRTVNNPDNTTTNLQHEDEVFQNLRKGVVSGGPPCGQNDEQITFNRVTFQNNTVAGYSSESQNALNNVFWYSQFRHNAVGVTNCIGESTNAGLGGNYYVYNSFFSGNTQDICGADPVPLAVRNNFSENVGSGGFFSGGGYQPWIISHNTVITSNANPVVNLYGPGGFIFNDNTIKAVTPLAYTADSGHPANLSSVGNTFSVANPESVCGVTIAGNPGNCSARWWSVDDTTNTSLTIAPPTMPGVVPRSDQLNRQSFEIGGPCGSSIQACITYACNTYVGNRPIVHIATAYNISSTLIIPSSCDVQIVGDGYGQSQLTWTGATTGPMFQLVGPAKATIRELACYSANTCVEIDGADQPGGRVFAMGIRVENARRAVVTTNGLQNTVVDLVNEQSSTLSSSAVTASVIGAGAGVGSSYLGFWGHGHNGPNAGVSSPSYMYSVSNGGTMYVQDGWDEVGYTGLINATGTASANWAGNFVYDGSHFPPGPDGAPAGGDLATISYASGTIGLFGNQINNNGSYRGITINTELPTTTGVFLDNFNDQLNGSNTMLVRNAPGSGTFFYEGNTSGDLYGSGSTDSPDTPGLPPGASLVRSSLSGYRNTWPQPLAASGSVSSSITDVRLFRVYMQSPSVGVAVNK